jgi:hypothetical protein
MNNRRLEIWILLADLVWILLAFWAADVLRYGTTWDPAERIGIHALVPFVAATCPRISLSCFMQMDGFRGASACPRLCLICLSALAYRGRAGGNWLL